MEFRKVPQEFKALTKAPSLFDHSDHSDAKPRRKDTFESPEIRSPTFDAKAQIFEIRILMLKPGVRKIQMVTKYSVWGSS